MGDRQDVLHLLWMKTAVFERLKLKAEVNRFGGCINTGFFHILSAYFPDSYDIFMTSGRIEQIGFILL